MTVKTYKPHTPGLRERTTIDFSYLSKVGPDKALTKYHHKSKGRNNQGRITIRHRGGGHKKLYRLIDFKRRKVNGFAVIKTIEYDPNRSANISLAEYSGGEKHYILHPHGLKVGDVVCSGHGFTTALGNAMPLKDIELGAEVHNIELHPGKGGQVARAAGCSAEALAKEKNYAVLKLSSKEIRLFREDCFATVGKVGNLDHHNISLGKAGRTRWLGIRPTVRGSAMNPIDHPHGGGEGRSPIGKPRPLTPWGKPALGFKTRKPNKASDPFIIKTRQK